MNKLKSLWLTVNGFKTYIVAVVTLLYAIGYYGFGQNDWGTAITLILGSSGLGALRHALPSKA